MVKVDWGWFRGSFLGLVLFNASLSACTVDDKSLYTFGSAMAAGGSSTGGSTAGAGASLGGRSPDGSGGAPLAGAGGVGGTGGMAGTGSSGSGGDGSSVVVTPGQVGTGKACLMNSDCMTGFCRDGVCCQDECAGACQACASTYTGLVNGVCGPARTGVDPHDDCDDESSMNPCGQDGQCDGAGLCRKYPLGRSCTDATCSDASTFVPAGTCDGGGQCSPGTAEDCGDYPCAVTGCAKPCSGNSECPANSYCANGTCRTKKLNGDACSSAAECGTGSCSPDQVCCDTDCTGACMACTNKLTGEASGTCAPVQQGLDPNDDCASAAADTCGNDGSCDGKGACQAYAQGTPCGAGSCSGATFTPGKVCNGTGQCTAGGTAQNCGSSACTASGCATSCTKDSDCATGSFCIVADKTCSPKKANGGTCAVGNECVSNACVDGVCCESACAGKCYACSNAKTGGTAGKCLPVKAGTDLDNDCDLADKTSCGQDGTCDGNGHCTLWSDGTQCAAGSCNASGNYVSQRSCAAGTCKAATTDVCAPAVCDATLGCKRTCAVKADCIGSSYCDTTSKTCAAQKSAGQACAAGGECLSGFCADKVCCNSACNGTCVSCLAKDTGQSADGTCSNVTDGTDPASECSAGTTACGLDGMCGGGKCRSAPTTKSCGTVSCSGSSLTPLSKCDGNGSCPTAIAGPCPGNVICASTTACRSSTCSADTDCISGYYCASGTCTQKKATGTACSGGSAGSNQCVSNICSNDNICCSTACSLSCQGCSNANTGAPNGTCSPKIVTPGARDLAPCSGACQVGYALCVDAAGGSGTCNPITWGFEGGFSSEWQESYVVSPVDFVGRVGPNGASPPHGGNVALVSTGNKDSFAWQSILGTSLCGDTRSMDVHGKTLAFYIYAPTPAPNAGSAGTCHIEYTGTDPAGDGFDGEIFPINITQYNAWTLYSGALTNSITKFRSIHLTCDFGAWPAGALYFDDISIK